MPDIMTGIAGASAVKGFIGSGKAEKKADAAAGAQGALAATMGQLADEVFQEWQETWKPVERAQAAGALRLLPKYESVSAQGLDAASRNARRYEDLYLPLEDRLLADIGRDPQARIDDASGRAIGDVDRQFDTARADLARSNFTSGLAPDDSISGRRQMQIAQAGARAREGNFAAENERRNVRSEQVGFLQQAPGRTPYIPGLPTPASAQSPTGAINALQAASGAQGNVTDYYTNKANTYGEAAGGGIDYLQKRSGDISAFFS